MNGKWGYFVELVTKSLGAAAIIVGLIVWAARVESKADQNTALIHEATERMNRTDNRVADGLERIERQLNRIEARIDAHMQTHTSHKD